MYYFPTYHWHLEISTKCTLKCPRCPRTEMKGEYVVGELSLNQIKKIFSEEPFNSEALKVTFCGGQGDPIYHSQFIEVIRFFKSFKVPKIITIITNGSHKSRAWWQELASILDYGDDITFSIDGYDDESNQKYRVNSDWESTMVGIEEMTQSRATVIWNSIYFRFNQEHLKEIRNIAKNKFVDGFRLTRSHLFASMGKAHYIDKELGYDPLEPDQNHIADYMRVSKEMEWFNPSGERHKELSKKYYKFHIQRGEVISKALDRQKESTMLPNCLFGYRGNYIDVEGYFYPCSWVSHPAPEESRPSYKKYFMNKNRSRLNLTQRSQQEVLSDPIWEELFATWVGGSEDIVRECGRKCQKEEFLSEDLQHYLDVAEKSKIALELEESAEKKGDGRVDLYFSGQFKDVERLRDWRKQATKGSELVIHLPKRERKLSYPDVAQTIFETFLFASQQIQREAIVTGNFLVQVVYEDDLPTE